MPLKLLHTADWQLGMLAPGVGAKAPRVQQARVEAARRVVDLANRAHVDVLVLAGDTFEDVNVPRTLVQSTVDLLRTSTAPVLVLPGNHDPLVPQGVFDHPAWRDAAPHVRVLKDAEPIVIGDAEILGCPLVTKRSARDPLSVLPDAPADRTSIRVVVAHGSLLGAGVAAQDIKDDFPMDLSHLTRAGIDYLALGHWHRPSSHKVQGVVRAVYAGSHEPTGFAEISSDGSVSSGSCVVVEMDGPGASPQLEWHRTAVLEWRRQREEILGAGGVARLRATLDAIPVEDAARTLLDLTLRGCVPVADLAQVEDLETLVQTRFLFARVNRDALHGEFTDHEWLKGLPAEAAAVGQCLSTVASGSGRDAQVAHQALMLLYQLSREG